MKKLMTLLMVLAFAGSLLAQITITGDAQVRPRLDLKNYGDYPTSTGVASQSDMYYMYRARLNVAADIGDGWFAKIRIAHYGYAEYAFTNGVSTDKPLKSSTDVTGRPSLAFTQLYLGVKKDAWGFWGGFVPMSGLKNPVLDVHFYPAVMIDIPMTIQGVGSRFGFAGYLKAGPGKLNVSITQGRNFVLKKDASDNVIGDDNHDTYSFGVNYDLKIAGFGIQPNVFYGWANYDKALAPLTYGVNVTSPKFAGFTLSASAVMSSQSDPWEYYYGEVTTTDVSVDTNLIAAATTKTGSSYKAMKKYDASLFRVKLTGKVGPGALTAWVDIAKRTDKEAGVDDVVNDYMYTWLAYTITVYKSDHGKFILMPRWRMITHKIANSKDYSRNKIELLAQIAFK